MSTVPLVLMVLGLVAAMVLDDPDGAIAQNRHRPVNGGARPAGSLMAGAGRTERREANPWTCS